MSDPEAPAQSSAAHPSGFSYKAFLSYSHAADGRLAAFLQGALQRFAKPWYRRRAIRVFRDTTGLEVTPDLWTSIRKALEASEYFILLASERAARSRWIELEIETWLRSGGAARLLIVWTDGHLAWDATAGDFNWERSTCLHRHLRGVFKAEPLHLDLRWARTGEDLSMRRPEAVDAVARLSAALRGLPLDDLLGEDVRQHRRTRRLAGAAIGTLGILLVVAAGAAWVALEQRDAARRSLVDLIVSNGTNAISEQDQSGAALWFAEALRLGEGEPREQDLQRLRLSAAVRTHPGLQQVWFTDPRFKYRSAVFGRDGPFVVGSARRGEIEWADGRVNVRTAEHVPPRVWDARTGAPLRLAIAEPQTTRVLAVDAASDRVRAVTLGPDGAVRVLDARSGVETLCPPDAGEVSAAEFSRDGRVILTESADNLVRLWDAGDGRLLAAIPHEQPLVFAGMTGDGRTVVSATADGTAHVWPLASDFARQTEIRLEHEDAVEQIDVSHDGGHVVTLANRTARLWHVPAGQPPSMLRSWIGVNHVEFSPTHESLLLADDFGEATIVGLDPVEPLVVVRQNGPVLHASFSPDGDTIATAGTDRVARVWNASSGTPLTPSLHHEQTVTSVSFDREQARLVTTTTEGIVRVWLLDTRPAALPHESVRRVEYRPDGRGLLSVSFEDVKLWDLNGTPPVSVKVGSQIYHARFSPDGRSIVTASEDGAARIWDAASGRELRAFRHVRRVHHVSFRPDGAWLATAGAAGMSNAEVSVWDVKTGDKLFSLPHPSQRPDLAEFSPDGATLLTSGARTASLWDLVTRRRLDAFRFDDNVSSASFSHDGTRLVVVSGRSTAKVFDVARAESLGPAVRHENYYLDHVEFGSDSNTLLVAGGGYLRVWDVRRGVPLTPPLRQGPGINVDAAASSRDGAFLATAARTGGAAMVWDARTGRALTPPLMHGPDLSEMAFSPNGSSIVTAGGNAVRLWPLSGDVAAGDRRLALYARLLAARQIDTTGGIVALDAAQVRRAWEDDKRY